MTYLQAPGSAKPESNPSAPKARDPVCGMTVDPATAKHRADHAGMTYYFCAAKCREKFLADPAEAKAKLRTTREFKAVKAAEATVGWLEREWMRSCDSHDAVETELLTGMMGLEIFDAPKTNGKAVMAEGPVGKDAQAS